MRKAAILKPVFGILGVAFNLVWMYPFKEAGEKPRPYYSQIIHRISCKYY